MLSNEAEHFLLKLRMELMAKGKKDEDIEMIEEELRDHLHEAELRGDSLKSVTGGSVDNYIKSISKELPFDRSMIGFIFLMVIAAMLFLIIPDLIRGNFNFSLYRLLYYSGLVLIGLPLEILIAKHLIVKYGDQKKTYVIFTLIFLLTLGLLVAGEILIRNAGGPNIATLDNMYSFWIGIALTIIFIILCIIFKNWFFVGVILYIILPDLMAKIIDGGSPESESYITVSTITYTIVTVVFATIFIIMTKKLSKE